MPGPKPQLDDHRWTFLTNHAHVLLSVSRDPDSRVRDLADQVGITERAVLRILTELEDAGYLSRQRTGRRNRYRVNPEKPLRHPLSRGHKVAFLLNLVTPVASQRKPTRQPARTRALPRGASAKRSRTRRGR